MECGGGGERAGRKPVDKLTEERGKNKGNRTSLRVLEQLNATDKAVTVLFTLLEKPSRIADVTGDENENYLGDAVNAIRKTIDDSQLIIQVEYGDSADPVSSSCSPSSLQVRSGKVRPGQGRSVQFRSSLMFSPVQFDSVKVS